MAQRNISGMSADELWADWRSGIEIIRDDVHELFSARKIFRDTADVFGGNPRLQEVGGYFWEWMRVSYASYVIMRIRRETDDQRNTVNLNQLLREIESRPEVITRLTYQGMLGTDLAAGVVEANDEYFSRRWTTEATRRDPGDPGADYVDSSVVAADRTALQDAVEKVRAIANRRVAHRTRVEVPELRFPEVDQAFDAIEKTLKDYYTLLQGAGLLQAEPVQQFNAQEVFTFPWIAP